MKKAIQKFTIMIVMIMVITMSFGLMGCEDMITWQNDPNNPIVISECGYFDVMLRKTDGYAIVLGLTVEGAKQEILAIPSQVQGFTVKQIGWHSGFIQISIKSEVLKKVYIPYIVTDRAFDVLSEVGEEYIFMPAESDIYEFDFGYGDCDVFVTKEYYEANNGDFDSWCGRLHLPNLIYFYNYDNAPNLGYFWFDNITGNNAFIDPVDPIRDGFEFTGWYLDEECTTEWEGEKPSSPDERLDLYAKWQEK